MITDTIRRLTMPVLMLMLVLAAPAAAQSPTRLTLADALRLATDTSEALEVARAGEARADANRDSALGLRLPQVDFSGSYSRTLASEFSSAFGSGGPPCAPLTVDPALPLGDRVSELERAATCGSLGPTFDLENLPFGQKNVYQLGLLFSQPLYAGGRIAGQRTLAEAGRRAASLATSLAQARVSLEVTQAFYDAALADRLVVIAESVYNQAAATYDQTRLSFDAGRQPEFELLRAQVARDNQRPVVIRRRADRDVAYVRLRQILELPAGAPLELDVNLEDAALAPPLPFADSLAISPTSDLASNLTVQQSETVVATREAAIAIARSARLPSVSLTSSLAGVGYPSSGVVPSFDDFRANWSVGATVQMSLFNGGRLRAGERAALADLTEAQAQLQQTREQAELDRATALQDLGAAQAVWEASAGTIQQAERAYQIAELRNREGLSTQLELADSRVQLELAQANRAQAARDVQVARARVALLPSLPAGVR